MVGGGQGGGGTQSSWGTQGVGKGDRLGLEAGERGIPELSLASQEEQKGFLTRRAGLRFVFRALSLF